MFVMRRGLRLGMGRKRKRKSYDDDDDDYDEEKEILFSSLRKKKATARSFRLLYGKKKNNSHYAHNNNFNKVKKKKKKAEEEEEDIIIVKKGDIIVDIKQLLFTKDRDYLIKHNNQRVQAKHLTGKVIVLHFVDLIPRSDCWLRETTCLVDIYNEMLPKGCLEVVFIAVTDAAARSKQQVYSTPEEQRFSERFSIMPWLAIPFSDLKSRRLLEERFGGISGFRNRVPPYSFVIDPKGVVLQCHADHYFLKYGTQGYPFSDERIIFLDSEDNAARKHPSITTLLTSPERDYVISNSGRQVAVSDLEDKVVALYFYEEDSIIEDFLPKLHMAYEELAKTENFEIVLIYVHDTLDTYNCTTDVSFRKKFSTMPWLALPFKDPNCKKLQRVFYYPEQLEEPGPDPTLVVIGPHGKYIELFGADILSNYGIAAYPFTRESAAKLKYEKAKGLKLEMIWRDPNVLFRQKDGPDVRFSQLVGKRTILLYGDDWFSKFVDFFVMLKQIYLRMKGTIDEFEVIHVYQGKSSASNEDFAAAAPWLTQPPLDRESDEKKVILSVIHYGCGLLAYDSDGMLIRRTLHPSVERENMDFPFHADNSLKDAVEEFINEFHWWDLL